MIAPSRASAAAEWSVWVRPASRARCARASAPSARAAASTARSSTPGASVSAGKPAASRSIRRVMLVEARSSGLSPRQSEGGTGILLGDEFQTVVAIEIEDGGGRLFDRSARYIDQRPAAARTQAARECDLLGDGVAIDVSRIVV